MNRFDYSKLIIFEADGAIPLKSIKIETDDENNVVMMGVPEVNRDYKFATVITIDGCRFAMCAKKIGEWEPFAFIKLSGRNSMNAEEFLLIDKKMRLAHFGGDEE